MNEIETHISNFLENDKGNHYFVACSGGVDSMVLLHILFKLGKRVSAVHVNYLLRDKDSEDDQALIEETCRDMKIPCHVKRVDLHRYLNEKGGNLQDEARKVRYSYFETFKVKHDFRIVLGQHADDQVETFFLNLARGSGIMGLACMLSEHNHYLRPLLPFSKEEIITYAKKNSIKWREDVSNASNKYSRNKLRNVILPELKNAIPTLQESVLILVDAFQQTQKELADRIKLLADKVTMHQFLSFEEFDMLDEFERIELLRQLEISSSILKELEKLRKAIKGKKLILKKGLVEEIINEGTYFYFKKTNQISSIPILQIESVNSLPLKFSKDCIFIDAEKIKGVLKIRRWEIGDRIKPIGIRGSKLISDILNDAKIPNHLRSDQFVVYDEEKIVWCVGLCVGREALATPGAVFIKKVSSPPSFR